jgi:uncharacterized flavoprotein (TIGR03862 family)
MKRKVAVVGTGPAGLMAAFVLATGGADVTIFEKRKSAGRKLLIAGSSGLNISYDCPAGELHEHYRGPSGSFKRIFHDFSREDWLKFVDSLGLETFKGTSRRYFVREMKAAGLLRAWTEKLKSLGVHFEFGKEAVGFEPHSAGGGVALRLAVGDANEERSFDAVGFFLGGGSWEPEETPLRWPGLFRDKSLHFSEFQSSNAGFEVDWPEPFLKEAEGLPIKSIALKTSRGTRKGELVVTSYGLEGTPVYAIGETGTVHIDLKPDLTAKEIEAKLTRAKENLAPMRRIKKYLSLCEGSQALLFHLTSPSRRADLRYLVSAIKDFPLVLKGPRPLAEAISSSGGLDWDELDDSLMLKKFPGVFAGGEMLNWDAPTGGFLIQGCVSQGHWVGRSMLKYLQP